MNSKIRKGIAINSLLVLTGSLLLAGLVGTLYTESPIAEAMLQGMGLVEQEVDDTIEVETKQQLSDIAELSFDRASDGGCAEGGTVDTKTEEGAYSSLSDTYLTATPECWGAESTYVRGATGYARDEGNDMEGLYSRIDFEISEERDRGIHLQTSDDSDFWLENHLLVAANEPYRNRVVSECTDNLAESAFSSLTILTEKVDIADLGSHHIGTDNYVIFFESEASDSRTSEWISNRIPKTTYCGFADRSNQGSPLPSPVETNYNPGPIEITSAGQTFELSPGPESVEIKLCPGDKGYVQVNKGHPFIDGEAGEGTLTGNDWKFPRMVITETGEECGNIQADIPDEANSVGNIFRLNADIDEGWSTLKHADLHKAGEDGESFYGTLNSYEIDSVDQNQCVLYLRERDGGVPDDGDVSYRTGTVLGHSEFDTFPDTDSPDVESINLPEGNWGQNQFREGENSTIEMYLHDGVGLENVGFTGQQLNNDIPFLKNEKGSSTSTFEPYGDLLCTKAAVDGENSRSSNARWVVCDESNYDSSSTTVDVERNGDTQQYTCTPGTGEWDLELEDPYEDNPNVE